jgi:uroporphyrinogen III methyltransferase/synthase
LADLPAKIRETGLKPPALIIVGEVVSLRERLNWFETLPLFGQSVVVTRAPEQSSELSESLRTLGAYVIELPTIAIRAPQDWRPLDNAIARLASYDWLIFTSANGVRFFIERLDASSRDLRDLRARICAIGPATAASLQSIHLKVDRMPEQYVAEGVLQAFQGEDLSGKRILLPRAKIARDLIPARLRELGAEVDVVSSYETVIPDGTAARAAALFGGEAKPGWITFTSSSTVRHFVKACGAERLRGVRVASIGPVTSATARELGLKVDLEARQYTVGGIVEGLVKVVGMAARSDRAGQPEELHE